MDSEMEASIKVIQTPVEPLNKESSRSPGLDSRIASTTIAPLHRGKVDHSTTDKDQQEGCEARKELGIGQREFSQNSSARRFGPGSSELDAVVAVAAPDNHGDREGEKGSQGCPTGGDQHGARFISWVHFT
jgi:hypothetical protein